MMYLLRPRDVHFRTLTLPLSVSLPRSAKRAAWTSRRGGPDALLEEREDDLAVHKVYVLVDVFPALKVHHRGAQELVPAQHPQQVQAPEAHSTSGV